MCSKTDYCWIMVINQSVTHISSVQEVQLQPPHPPTSFRQSVKELSLISEVRKSILRASLGLNSMLIPSDRHFIFNNNHLLLRPRGLSNPSVGGPLRSNMAGGRMAVCDRGAICQQAD